jgi:hypothetical protein
MVTLVKAKLPTEVVAEPMVTAVFPSVILEVPLDKVTLVKVKLPTVVVVLPRPIDALPSVATVLKLTSSWDNGIDDVAFPKIFGTGILKPHS